eukprot:2229435-Prymnesium_polylepis.1
MRNKLKLDTSRNARAGNLRLDRAGNLSLAALHEPKHTAGMMVLRPMSVGSSSKFSHLVYSSMPSGGFAS